MDLDPDRQRGQELPTAHTPPGLGGRHHRRKDRGVAVGATPLVDVVEVQGLNHCPIGERRKQG
jgi:hypothetical protein